MHQVRQYQNSVHVSFVLGLRLFGGFFGGALGAVLPDPAKFLFDFVVTVVIVAGFQFGLAAAESRPLLDEVDVVNADDLQKIADMLYVPFRARLDQNGVRGMKGIRSYNFV